MLQRWPVRRFFILLLLLAYLSLTYRGALSPVLSLSGSFLIMLIGRALWPESWKDRLGLAFPWRDLLLALLGALLLVPVFIFAVRAIAEAQGILYRSPFQQHGFLHVDYIHTLGQTLNEEMVLGALLLGALQLKFRKTSPFWIATLTAAAFSLLHSIFYGWIVPPKNYGLLTVGTLFALFAIGLLRNTLILRARHIAFAWSLHLSINLAGLWGFYLDRMGNELNEPEIFNLVLGSGGMILLSVFVLPLCAVLLTRDLRLRWLPVPPGR